MEVIDYVVKNEYCDFYKKLYKGASDFKKLPLISKSDIEGYPGKFLFVDFEEVISCRETSGTGGKRLLFYRSKKDAEAMRMKRQIAMSNCFPEHSRIMLLLPFMEVMYKYALTLKEMGHVVVLGNIYELLHSAELAVAMGIDAVYTSTTLALKMGELLNAGYSSEKITKLVLGAELLSPPAEKELKRRFPSARIIRGYGMAEFGTVGYQCKEIFGENKFHTFPEYFVYEAVNPDTGEPFDEGELVMTNLWVGSASPLIRYRTGDLVRLLKNNCPCGAEGPMISVLGRVGFDRVRVSGITLHRENFERALSFVEEHVKDYQIHICEEEVRGRVMPYIAIDVVPRKGSQVADEKIADVIMENFELAKNYSYKKAVEKRIFLPMEVGFVDEIDKKGFKKLEVIDHRLEK